MPKSTANLIGILTPLAGAVLWYDGRQDEEHVEIKAQMIAGDVELDLQRVELELKLLRTIQERRELTEDELDRLEYLKQLRAILIEEQRKKA